MDQIKNNLINKWCFWLQIKPRDFKLNYESYNESLINFVQFKNLKEFFEVIELSPLSKPSNYFYDNENNIEKFITLNIENNSLSKNPCNINNIMLFKDGIKPIWEDKVNKIGGHITYDLKNIQKEEFDGIFKHILIDIIGGRIPNNENIVGFRFLDKLFHKNIKLEIWLNIAKNKDNNVSVIENLSENFETIIKIYFEKHQIGNYYFENHNKLKKS